MQYISGGLTKFHSDISTITIDGVFGISAGIAHDDFSGQTEITVLYSELYGILKDRGYWNVVSWPSGMRVVC
jgi:hypothetical protein